MNQNMPLGKIDPDSLRRYVLDRLPPPSERVIVGPAVGEDVAVINMGGLQEAYMIVSSDPISGAETEIGRYAVHVNANDVATAGARPSLFACNVMMSRSASPKDLDVLFSQVSGECRRLGISIIGGHTEVSPIERTIVSSTMIGFVSRKALARRAVEPGDVLVITKGAGIEGTSIIAAKRGKELASLLGEALVRGARRFSARISVVPEAMIAAEEGVKRMHDPTEGGVLGGLMEMCVANRISARVETSKIPVAPETDAICGRLGIDPLKLIGSGSLLCVFAPEAAGRVAQRFRADGIPSARIGTVERVGKAKVVLVTGSREEEMKGFPTDELWGAIL